MEIDVVDGVDDIVLMVHFRSICGGQGISWLLTRTKMTPVVPIIWLAETANREGMLGIVDILSDLAPVQYDRQSIEAPQHQRLYGYHNVQLKMVLLLAKIHMKCRDRDFQLISNAHVY